MAFNPQIGDTGVPNMTGASQGQIPDRSFENLFEGLTKTFENVTEIKDTSTQLDIRDQADKMFEDVNTEFGVAAPAGLTDELDKMSGLQAALTQGKISQVNYYGRLATLSKQLRSKYPGYEHIVDATIQSVTGTRPANAYRDAIFQEISNLQEGASSEEKFRRQWTKENEGVLFSIFGEDYFKNPDAYDFNKVQAEVARWKGRAEMISAETQALDRDAKLGNRNDVRAAKQIDRDFSFVVESTLNRSLGLNQPSAMDKINQFVAAGGGTPQELDQVIVQLSELEATTRAELLKRGRQNYVSSGLVSAEAMNKAVEQAMYPITQAKQAILGGDFKLAARYATIAKAQTDQQLNEMLKDPTFRTGQGLTEINQTLGDEFFTRNYEAAETAALEVTGRTIAGQTDVIKNVMSDGNSKLAVPILQNSFKAIVDPKLTGDKFSNVIDQFFGPQAFDFMSPKNVSPEDLETLYLQFLRPEVTKAIFTRGSEQDKQKYVDWAMTKAVAIPSFRAAAGDLVSLQNQAEGMFDLQFDPQSMRLGANFKGFTMSGQRQTIGKAVDSFNKVMSVLKPIWDAEGIDGQVAAKQFVQQMSISLENTNPANAGGRGRMSDEGKPESQTFWGSVWDALMAPIGEKRPSGSPTDREERNQLRSDLGSLEDIDFITTASFEPDQQDEVDGTGEAMSFVDPRTNPSVSQDVLARFGNRKLPAALRLNNMGAVSIVGDISKSWAAKQAGFVGAVPRPKNEGGYYAQYATPEHGVAAASNLLKRYGRKGTNTPVEITRKWAAEPGNYPNVLVKYLRQAGFDVDKNTELNLNDPQVRLAILKAKSAHESGAGRPTYDDSVFERGVMM